MLLACFAMFSAVVLCGCGQGSRKLTAADLKAFEGASPELKQSWAQAQSSSATNDYVLAILTLRSMLSRNLSKEQMDAVQHAIITCDGKLMKAADRGDVAAQKALETLRSPGPPIGR